MTEARERDLLDKVGSLTTLAEAAAFQQGLWAKGEYTPTIKIALQRRVDQLGRIAR